MENLQGKVAVVTGAGSGIGRGMAAAAAQAGMKVVLADIDQEGVDAVASEMIAAGHEAIPVVTDVADIQSVTALKDAAISLTK